MRGLGKTAPSRIGLVFIAGPAALLAAYIATGNALLACVAVALAGAPALALLLGPSAAALRPATLGGARQLIHGAKQAVTPFISSSTAGWWAIEAPAVLLLISTLVFRIRPADQLAQNPLDTAGLFRAGCVAAAGTVILLTNLIARQKTRIPAGLWLFLGYTSVVFVGAAFSTNLALTAYRGVELGICVLFVAGVYANQGAEGLRRLGSTLYFFALAILALLWLGAAAMPELGFERLPNASIPFRLRGSINPLSANDAGMYGVIVAIWSAARLKGGRTSGARIAYVIAAVVGTATVAATQYRSGYFALMACTIVVLGLRRRLWLTALLISAAAVLSFWGPDIFSVVREAFFRDAPAHVAAGLNGRLNWWGRALDVWKESPLIGRGLLTATRFDVLQPIGREVTANIHSTWVEALVGTGLAGAGLLVVTFCSVFASATRRALCSPANWAGLAILVALSVRTLTGNTFESFSYWAMLYLVLVAGRGVLEDPAALKSPDRWVR